MKLFSYILFIPLYLGMLLFAQIANAQSHHFKASKHYTERMKIFTNEGRIAADKVIMFGDSHMEFGGNWNRFFNTNHLIVNRGIIGDDAIGMYHRLPEIIAAQPRAVFFDCGTNDLSHGLAIDKVYNNIIRILNELHSACPATQIFVHSLLPLCPEKGVWRYMKGKGDMIIALNKRLKEYCEASKFIYIDIYDDLLGKDKKTMKPSYCRDGLHLTEEGYKVWAAKIKPYVEI